VDRLFEDREGNIWVATSEGLDQFRDLAVATYSVKQGLASGWVTSVLAARDGSIWMGTSVELNRWDRGHVTSPWRPANVVGVGSIFQDSLQRIWAATPDEVGYLDASRFVALERVGGGLIRWIAEDIDANVWIANAATGLFRFSLRTGNLEHTRWDSLEQGAPAIAMAADRSMKGVWLGFQNGLVKYFADGQVRASYGTAEGIGNGLRSLYLDRDGAVWVSTDMGLSRVKNGRVATLTVKNGLPCDGIEWLVEDDDRALWLGARCGLVRLAPADLAAWVTAVDTEHNARRAIKTTVFDSTDGVRIYIGAWYYSQPAVKAPDGRLWFMSKGGVSVVDPRALPHNRPSAAGAHRAHRRRPDYLRCRWPGTWRHAPAATDTRSSNRLHRAHVRRAREAAFRYKARGPRLPTGKDVGTRRQAFYNDLPLAVTASASSLPTTAASGMRPARRSIFRLRPAVLPDVLVSRALGGCRRCADLERAPRPASRRRAAPARNQRPQRADDEGAGAGADSHRRRAARRGDAGHAGGDDDAGHDEAANPRQP
jgi:hypothetical protein